MHEHHTHHHTNQSDNISGKDELCALLSYMVKHNESHTSELNKLAEKLKAFGFENASAEIKSAIDSYALGNAKLSKAIEMIENKE